MLEGGKNGSVPLTLRKWTDRFAAALQQNVLLLQVLEVIHRMELVNPCGTTLLAGSRARQSAEAITWVSKVCVAAFLDRTTNVLLQAGASLAVLQCCDQPQECIVRHQVVTTKGNQMLVANVGIALIHVHSHAHDSAFPHETSHTN